MAFSRPVRRAVTILGVFAVVAALCVALLSHFVDREEMAASSQLGTPSRTDPPLVAQAAQQQRGHDLLQLTRKEAVEGSPEDGGALPAFQMAFYPDRGWQPLWNFPIDMAPCAEAAARPAWVWHET